MTDVERPGTRSARARPSWRTARPTAPGRRFFEAVFPEPSSLVDVDMLVVCAVHDQARGRLRVGEDVVEGQQHHPRLRRLLVSEEKSSRSTYNIEYTYISTSMDEYKLLHVLEGTC